MKKLIITALALTLTFALAACSGEQTKIPDVIWKFNLHAIRKFFWFCRGCGNDPELYGAGVG